MQTQVKRVPRGIFARKIEVSMTLGYFMKAIFLSKVGKTSSPLASPDVKFYTHDLKSKVESKFISNSKARPT